MEKKIKQYKHDPNLERIVKYIGERTQIEGDDHFIRTLALSTISRLATSTRCHYQQGSSKKRIANTFCLVLAKSGYGKGFCQGILDDFFTEFYRNQLEASKSHIEENVNLLVDRKIESNPIMYATREDAFEDIYGQIEGMGETPSSFGAACTLAGIRQIFLKLAMQDAGAIHWFVDEMASNYSALKETFATMLELWDGDLKANLIKNMDGQKRIKHCPSYRVPTSMLLMGSPNRLWDGGSVENDFNSQLEAGMSRRMITAMAKGARKKLTIQEQYDLDTSVELATEFEEIKAYFGSMCTPDIGRVYTFEKEALMTLYEYNAYNQKRAEDLIEDVHEIERAEILERKDKASRIATILAFYGKQSEVTLAQVEAAILINEESGASLKRVIYRDPLEARLCKYLLAKNQLITYPKIASEIKFFPNTKSKANEFVDAAESWGLEHGIVIERVETGKIRALRATELTLVDPNSVRLCITKDPYFTNNYKGKRLPFNSLHRLLQSDWSYFTAHAIQKGVDGTRKRCLSNMAEGFQLLVLDIDRGNLPFNALHKWLEEYTYLIHETTSSTIDNRRYRIIIPMKYSLFLDAEKYKLFYKNVIEDFNVFGGNLLDASVCDMSRAWGTPSVLSDGREVEFWYNRETPSKFSPFDTSPYLENTFKREQMVDTRKRNFKEPTKLLQWLHENALEGKHLGRNNTLIRMLAVLHESGQQPEAIRKRILDENKRFKEPLPEEEVLTVLNGSFNKHFTVKGEIELC